MKICIATSGTRGDVQPYIALGLELASRGHEVVIATEERMADFVKSYSLPFKKIAGDPQAMVYDKDCQKLLAKGQIMPVLKASEKFNAPFYNQALQDYAAAAQGVDLIVTAALCITQTLCVAQAMNVPWVPVMLGPVLPTGEFPSWLFSATPFRFKWLNRFTYTFLFWALWQSEKAKINAWRKASLGLPPLRWAPYYAIEAGQEHIPTVMMCSKHIIPGQAVPKDWPPSAHLTGPAFVPDTPTDAIDPVLRQFMEAGEDKPVYLGFGSMPAPDPKALLELAVKVVQLTGRRAVLCAGWSELASVIGTGPDQVQLPEGRLLVVPSAPHDWLLPRCCAAVHHAGVGTCNAALRAGVPSVPCPVMLDQPINAFRLLEAGVATPAIPFAKLTAEALSANIKAACSDEAMQQKATAAAASIAADYPGVKGAADVVLSATNPWAKLQGKL